ncbi:MAG: hypothetical protein J6T59_01530 [Bacteroidales bacterium]|nr:hypothetical protein [Bacteroidales bacterium]
MKNFQKHVMIFLLVMGMAGGVFAQAPYKHSIGVTVGNFEALSYKTFCTNHLALQLDLGYKYTVGASRHINLYINSLELNPNLMYEGHFTKGLYGFIGGGVSLGYSWNYWGYGWDWVGTYRSDYGKFGVNGILGLEYKFNIPLTLQIDFRPGYGMLFNEDVDFNYFDWSVNAGVRYTF